MNNRINSSWGAGLALGLLCSVRTIAGDVVVIMAPGATPVSREAVADIYLGRSSALRPLDLPQSSTIRDAFYRKATDRDTSQVKALWSRIIFTGQGQPPKEMSDAAAVKKAVAGDARTIGYIDKADVDASVRVVLTLP
jgi:hypothetical protein